jgi:hypothetical protein
VTTAAGRGSSGEEGGQRGGLNARLPSNGAAGPWFPPAGRR